MNEKMKQSSKLLTQPVFVLSQDFNVEELANNILANIIESSSCNTGDLIRE